MSFQDELNRALAESRTQGKQHAQQQEAESRTRSSVALAALDRLGEKCRETAAFLTAHHVPTEPFVEEWIVEGFLSSKRRFETLAEGWVLDEWLAISMTGEPWQVSIEQFGARLVRSKPWDLENMKELIAAGETELRLPMQSFVLELPRWDAESDSSIEDAKIRVTKPHAETCKFRPGDFEPLLTQAVVSLVQREVG